MRYMMLIYSGKTEKGKSLAEQTTCTEESTAAHWAIMDETNRRGIFRGAEPLEPAATATTIRTQNGKVTMTDGPFAETKEQLGGYYIMDCKDVDEALEWGAKIASAFGPTGGCVEVRQLRALPARAGSSQAAEYAKA